MKEDLSELDKRVASLLFDPNRGTESIGVSKKGVEINSNCFGTSVYLIGGKTVRRARIIGRKEVRDSCEDESHHPSFFLPRNSPGYIYSVVMGRIIAQCFSQVDEHETKDGDLAVWRDIYVPSKFYSPIHTLVRWQEGFVHQFNCGSPFGFLKYEDINSFEGPIEFFRRK